MLNVLLTFFKEVEFINHLGYDFFTSQDIMEPSAGLWVYGYTSFPEKPDISKINSTHEAFVEDLKRMKFKDKETTISTYK